MKPEEIFCGLHGGLTENAILLHPKKGRRHLTYCGRRKGCRLGY